MRELVAGLADEAAVAVARCRPDDATAATKPLAELLRGLAGDDPVPWIRARFAGDERAATIEARVLGVLGRSEEPAQPGEIAWAIRRMLEAAAQERPLVAVLEDVHWADPELLDLVEYTLAFSGGAPIVLLCLARPELLEVRPGWGTPQPRSTLVPLAPLEGEAALAPAGGARRSARARGGGADRRHRRGQPAVPRAAARRRRARRRAPRCRRTSRR